MVAARPLLVAARILRADSIAGPIVVGTVLETGAIIAPVALLFEAPVPAGFRFETACILRADFAIAPLALAVSRLFPPGWPMLEAGAIIAPVAFLVRPALAPRTLFQALRVLRIEDGVQGAHDPVQLLRRCRLRRPGNGGQPRKPGQNAKSRSRTHFLSPSSVAKRRR